MEKILQVKNLTINFRTVNGQVQAVRNVSFDLHKGKTMAIVGESGSGKSVTSRAILGILANNGIVKAGNIYYSGQDLLKITEDDFHKIRGDKIAMIFQDPLSSLNPIVRIGKQLTEAMILKNKANRKNSRKEFNIHMAKLVEYMNITTPDAEVTNKQKSDDFNKFEFKHLELENAYNVAKTNAEDLLAEIDNLLFELSKGVVDNYNRTVNNIIKFAPQCQNQFFISDISTVLENVEILKEIKKDALTTGDFSEVAKAINIIKNELLKGQQNKAPNFFSLAYYLTYENPEYPYDLSIDEVDEMTRKLLDDNFMLEFIARAEKALKYSYDESIENTKVALKSIDDLKAALNQEVVDEKIVKELFKVSAANTANSIDKLDIYRTSLAYTYGSSVSSLLRKYFNADKVNAKLQKTYDKQKKQYDKIIAKGKTPNWNLIPIELIDKKEILKDTLGHIEFIQESLVKYVEETNVDFNKRAVDLIDFYKQKASNIVTKVSKRSAKTKAIKLMQEVGIPEPYKRYRQYPFEFSGGMRQRIVIAIALAADPEILICDEPTTALDVTIQSQILELINKLKQERNLSIIFITHDMGVVANMADEISVMYAGKIVEYGTAEDIFYDPRHPYTWALLSSMPDLDTKEKLESIPGTPPNMIYPPKGDAFAERNKYAMKIDFEQQPPMFKVSDTHYAATWLLHPNAPKVEMPSVLKDRIEKMKKAAVNEDE